MRCAAPDPSQACAVSTRISTAQNEGVVLPAEDSYIQTIWAGGTPVSLMSA
jgi:hypothetical protein